MASLLSLYTIGYQGRSVDSFLSDLQANDVDVVLDVRYTPWSRRPAFGRSALARTLEAGHIQYAHLRELGSAPELRKELHATGDWHQFAADYLAHVRSLNGTLEAALAPYSGQRVCLLCMEADVEHCHRSLLAAELLERGLSTPPVHL
ncbi:MAG: DUF488 domain-containing protein [Dehalococcoidales bacterium]|nr:DUF488 domain-containing protein [Dehalococcoidales bacterium]